MPKQGGLPDTFISRQEQQAIAFVNQGNDLFNKGRYQESEGYYRQALELFPQADNIKVNLANALIRNSLESEARIITAELLLKDPQNKDYLLLSALIEYFQKDYKQAAEKYEKILDDESLEIKDDEKNQIYNNLSTIYFMLGEEQEAFCLADFAYRVRKDSENKNRLARLTLALMPGREGVLDKRPDGTISRSDTEFFLYSTLFYFSKGDFKKAIDLAAELESLSRGSDTYVEQARTIELLAKHKLGDITEEQSEELSKGILNFYNGDILKDNIRLYWPIEVIEELKNWKSVD